MLLLCFHWSKQSIHGMFAIRRLYKCGIWQTPNSCRSLGCYLLNSEQNDINMWHVLCTCRAVVCQTFVHFDLCKIPIFLGMTNSKLNTLSLEQVLYYTLLVICRMFAKYRMCVATFT